MRYLNSRKASVLSINYDLLKTKNGREKVVIYRTVDFEGLRDKQIEIVEWGIWRHGTSLIRIANEVYGDPSYWWTIGLVNNKPTDQHYKIGDIVFIPTQPDIFKNSIGE